MVWGFVYAPGEQKDGSRPRSAKAMFLGEDGYPRPQGHSRAEFVEIRYNEHGFEAELHYKDREGHPMPGPDDAYGRRAEYDREGRRIRMTALNDKDEPMNDAVGNAGYEAKYDEDGNEIEERAFDAKSKSTLVKSGFYRKYSRYDQWGRATETTILQLVG